LTGTWFLRPVTNAGTMNITGISSINPNPSSSGSNNGSLTNTGVINLMNNGWLQPQYGSTFTNNTGGQIIAVSGASTIDTTSPFGGPVGIFINNGAVIVNAGASLAITNGSATTNAGTFTTAAGGVLDFSMAATSVPIGTVYLYTGALTNNGTMSFSSGTSTVSGMLANNGVLGVAGTLNLNGTYTGNAGSSINLSGGVLTIATGVTLSTPTLTMTGGTLNGAGNVVVTNSFSQGVGLLGKFFGSVSITQSTGNLAIGAVGATGAINLAAPLGMLTVNGPITAVSISGLSATGVNLAATGTLTASGAGNAIVLNAGKGNFTNGAGPAALTVTSGRWLVYSTDPALNTFGGLISGNLDLWGKTYATYAPGSVVETGNRYLFALTPTLTATVNLVPTVINEIVDISNQIHKIPEDVLAVNTLTTGDGGDTQELPMCN
jgi:hypothetical protein